MGETSCADRMKSALITTLQQGPSSILPSYFDKSNGGSCWGLVKEGSEEPASYNIVTGNAIAMVISRQQDPRDLVAMFDGLPPFPDGEKGSWIYAGWSLAAQIALYNRPEALAGSWKGKPIPTSIYKKLVRKLRSMWAFYTLHASLDRPDHVDISWSTGEVLHEKNFNKRGYIGPYVYVPPMRASPPDDSTWFARNDINWMLASALKLAHTKSNWHINNSFAGEAIDEAFDSSSIEDLWCCPDRLTLVEFLECPNADNAKKVVDIIGSPMLPLKGVKQEIFRDVAGNITAIQTPRTNAPKPYTGEGSKGQDSLVCADYDVINNKASFYYDNPIEDSSVIEWEWKVTMDRSSEQPWVVYER